MNASQQGADAPNVAGRWLTVNRTLCFVTHGEEVLLMKRSASRRIFPGRYNGLGGHIERDEDPLRCAQREISEESGIHVPLAALHLHGISVIDAGQAAGIMLFVFTAGLETKPVRLNESAEGTLHWVSIQGALDLPVVDDLPLLWPRLFPNNKPIPGNGLFIAPFFAHVSYDRADQLVMRFAQETY